MGTVIGHLTHGELWQVFGRLLIEIGKKDDAGEFDDGVGFSEVFDLFQGLLSDLLKEYSDEE